MTATHENIEEQATAAQTPASETAETTSCTTPDKAVIDAIIRKRVYAAIGVGFIPLPLVDFAGLTGVQFELIHALSKAHGIAFNKASAKSIISSLCGGALTTASVPLASSLLKCIPVIGVTAGAASISIMGGASTYALGWVFDRHFRKGGTLKNFDTQEAKVYFNAKLEEGKDLVGKLKSKVCKKEAAAADETMAEAEATATA